MTPCLERRDMSIKTVGIVGCGLMGSGIAQVVAQAGYPTTVVEASQDLLDRGLGGIRRTLMGLAERGKIPRSDAEATLGRLTGAVDLGALKACDLVIEAITENIELKKETFARLDEICPTHAILASNTSSCTITELAAATDRPGQVVGLHFFNPAPVMKLVEVVRTILTDEASFKTAWSFVQSLGKTPVATQDTTGFIVNRLLVPYLLEAVRLLESGVASKEDIDEAMRLGCGYPMGPFRLLDLVGLDTTMFVAEVMFAEFREPRFAPPSLLKRLVAAGRLGKKSGQGFYDYAKREA